MPRLPFFFVVRRPLWAYASSMRFLDHTQTDTHTHTNTHTRYDSSGRGIGPSKTPLYLTIHNTLKRETSMPPAAFEPPIQASERRQTHALDRAVTGIGSVPYIIKLQISIDDV